MEIIKITKVTDGLAQMVALFRVELRSYKGIESKPNKDAGREEMEEYLAAGFPVFAAMVDGQYRVPGIRSYGRRSICRLCGVSCG